MRNVLVAALFAAACSGGTVVQSSACNQTVTGSSLNGTAYAPLGCEEVFGNIDGIQASANTSMSPGNFSFSGGGQSGNVEINTSGSGQDTELATITGGNGAGVLTLDWSANMTMGGFDGGYNDLYVDGPAGTLRADFADENTQQQLSGTISIPFTFGVPFEYTVSIGASVTVLDAAGGGSDQVTYGVGQITGPDGQPGDYAMTETDPNSVPEPGSFVLMALGGIAFAVRSRLSRKRA
jgi:hypothetical protein